MKSAHLVLSIGVALLLTVFARTAGAQESLASVKTLYASAAYEDALSAIDKLRTAAPAAPDSRGLEQYRAFCLLALGREAEATKALEALITADPFVVPDPNEVSPRVFTLFHNVRRRLLPPLVQQKYAMAKATYDRKEYDAAADQFGRVVTLMDDPDMDQKAPGLGDLRTLAGGFLDLAKNAAAPPKPPQPVVTAPPQPPPKPVKSVFDGSDPDVAPPVMIRQDMPAWPTAANGLTNAPVRPGVIEIVIDESGRVEHAVMRQSIASFYDSMVLSATANWRYKPALRDGVPVKFRKLIQIAVDLRK
jgi:tetratricopeptide (TPR) repeat protein